MMNLADKFEIFFGAEEIRWENGHPGRKPVVRISKSVVPLTSFDVLIFTQPEIGSDQIEHKPEK